MKKNYKEKYLELKKENEYLKKLVKQNYMDLNDWQLEYFKSNLDKVKILDMAKKYIFIMTIITITVISIFTFIHLFLG